MPQEIPVQIGPDWIKKVMVVSHERSGTHFLMNTIADNFGYDSVEWIDLDIIGTPCNFWAEDNVKSYLEVFNGMPILNLFKSHYPVDFFGKYIGDIAKEFQIFYVYRHEKEVMDSFCKHLNAIEWDAGPKVADGETLAKAAPSGAVMRYQKVQYPTMLDRLTHHVMGWLKVYDKVSFISFDALRDDFETTVKNIAKVLGHEAPMKIIRPSKFDRVITPNFGGK